MFMFGAEGRISKIREGVQLKNTELNQEYPEVTFLQ
jgi:hypothetical protein